MADQFLLNTVSRWRPELQKMTGLELVGVLIDLSSLLYWLPFAMIGLVWLSVVTDLSLIRETWIILLSASIIGWIFRQLEFTLRLEVRPGVFALAGGSFEMLVFWSLALLFGSTALWAAGLMSVFNFLWQIEVSQFTRWYRWRELAEDIAVATLVGQIALALYDLLGGHPLASTGQAAGDSPIAIFAATMLWFALPRLMGLPLLLYASRSPEIVGSGSLTDRSAIRRFLLAGNSISGIADLFAMLAATIYVEQNATTYFIFVGGALLTALLANRLSEVASRSERRAREMEILQRISHDLMTAPDLEAALPNILAEYIGSLFPQGRVEIRLFPDEVLFRRLPQSFRFGRSMWQRLQDRIETTYLQTAELPPRDPDRPQWAGIAVPILEGQAAAPQGVICLISTQGPRGLEALEPSLYSLARQIASALLRMQLQRQALEEQAEFFQKEVYAQAYQAEVYAQALALEKMTQELEVAGRIQSSFLPEELPDLPGWQVSVAFEPAREASGDFYDFIRLPNGHIGLVIADVAEKGMGAALYMALSRTLIRTYALEHDTAPEMTLQAANKRILADTHSDLFVTVFYAILDTESGQLTFCNAGHNPPLLLQHRNGSAPLPLTRTALPLGIMEQVEWECARVQLMPGDVLAMYTDGVTEAQDEDERFFGEDRLRGILSANANRSADVIEDKIISAVYEFSGEAPQYDDIALMVLIREIG